MRLTALTAGLGVESAPFKGTLHSVFAHACNIELSAGRLIALVARGTGAVPWGFQLSTPPGFRFLDHVRSGQAVACRGGILRVAGALFSVDLRTARRWRSGLCRLALDLERPEVKRAWSAAWSMVVEKHEELAFPRQAAKPIAQLLRATRRLCLDDAAQAASGLIGLGAGLTPAGDDFLVGFLAGLWCSAGANPGRQAFLAGLGASIAATDRTNAISRRFLEAAVVGEVSERLAVVADRIAHAAVPEAVGEAVRAALAVGASSGTDGMIGFLTGARSWRRA
jgi:hypothetical protein